MSKVSRLDVYAEGYFSRVAEGLAADFAALDRVLRAAYDEDGFRILIAHYLMEHPSRSQNIGDVGKHLPEFLRSYTFTQELPWLPDLARLEWAVIESFYADRMPALDLELLQAASEKQWESARFVLDSSTRLIETGWPVESIRNGTISDNDACGDIAGENCHYLVHRQEREAEVFPVTSMQAKVLNWIRESHSLGTICGKVELNADEAAAASVMTWFQEWVGQGLIRKVIFS